MIDIQIVSDTHLEFRGDNFKNLIKPSAPILFLLGDISACGSPTSWETYKKFIIYLSKQYKYIFHVPGNHEYYTSNRNITMEDTIPGIDAKLRKFAKTIDNLYYLNNNTVNMTLNNRKYVFIGTALWTGVKPESRAIIQSMMNDYSNIYVPNEQPKNTNNTIDWKPVRKYNIEDMSKLHTKAVNML